jgi:hypothetical protein
MVAAHTSSAVVVQLEPESVVGLSDARRRYSLPGARRPAPGAATHEMSSRGFDVWLRRSGLRRVVVDRLPRAVRRGRTSAPRKEGRTGGHFVE